MATIWQHQSTWVLGATLALLVVAAFLSPGFDSPLHLMQVIALAALLAIAALGQTVIMLTGGIDLSMGFVMTLAGAMVMQIGPSSLGLALVATLAMGALVGLVNGVGIQFVRVPPLIMTLATGSIAQGVVYLYTGGATSSVVPAALYHGINGSVFGKNVFFPNAVLIAILLGFGVTLLLQRTVFGQHVYAIGSGTQTARLSGIPVSRVLVWVYVLGGLFASAAGILVVSYYGQESLDTGSSYLLPAIAAVVLGGTSMLGGEGTYIGTVIGALLLTVLTSLLTVLNLSTAVQQILYGLVILVMLVVHRRGLFASHSPT